MSNAPPTATKVLDGFLAARPASVMPLGHDADREVVDWLRDLLQIRGLEPIDDLTAYLLAHSTGRSPTERELAAVLSVVEAIPTFFADWLPAAVGASAQQVANAARVVRVLGRWLLVRGFVDEDVCEHLARYTSLYDGAEQPVGSAASPR